MPLVLDTSMTLAWFMPGEQTPESQQALDHVISEGAVVPAIWRLEVGNILLLAESKQRMQPEHRARAMASLLQLPISIDPETETHAWHASWLLAYQCRLTLYDACYLELARRRSLPLATLDADLRRAAGACGVTLFGA